MTDIYCDSFSMLIRSSLSEKYGLGASLPRKCSEIFTSLLEQCQTMECCEIAAEFLARTEAEAVELEELQRHELNCEYARFFRSGGLKLEPSGDIEAKMEKLQIEIERLNKILNEPLTHLVKSESKEVYNYCLQLRRDLTMIITMLSEVSEQANQQKALSDIVELLQQNTTSLANNFYLLYPCESSNIYAMLV